MNTLDNDDDGSERTLAYLQQLLQCRDVAAIERVTGGLDGPLTKALDKHATTPCSDAAIIAILPACRRGVPITAAEFAYVFGFQEAIEDQAILGWNNFLLGRWSPKW